MLSNFEGIVLKMIYFLWIFQNISKLFKFIKEAHFVHCLCYVFFFLLLKEIDAFFFPPKDGSCIRVLISLEVKLKDIF